MLVSMISSCFFTLPASNLRALLISTSYQIRTLSCYWHYYCVFSVSGLQTFLLKYGEVIMLFIKRMAVLASLLLVSSLSFAEEHGDNQDLDDIRNWDIVSIETCLDAALDLIPGNARKVEMKMESGVPIYEFDIESTKDGSTYNVECDAEKGFIAEVEREVDKNDPYFKKHAKISESDARSTVLAVHPGKIVANEYEVGFDGSVTYEFDIQTNLGYEIKVDVDATTGKIEEANIELYEIGSEKE